MHTYFVRATSVTVLSGAVATLAIMGFLGGSELLFSTYALWALLPFAALIIAATRAISRAVGLATLVSGILTSIFGVVVYGRSSLGHIDPQVGLIFLFTPIYQLALAVPILLLSFLSWFLNWRTLRNERHPRNPTSS